MNLNLNGRILVCLILFLVAIPVNGPVAAAADGQEFLLLFSGNVGGEMEPCG